MFVACVSNTVQVCIIHEYHIYEYFASQYAFRFIMPLSLRYLSTDSSPEVVRMQSLETRNLDVRESLKAKSITLPAGTHTYVGISREIPCAISIYVHQFCFMHGLYIIVIFWDHVVLLTNALSHMILSSTAQL